MSPSLNDFPVRLKANSSRSGEALAHHLVPFYFWTPLCCYVWAVRLGWREEIKYISSQRSLGTWDDGRQIARIGRKKAQWKVVLEFTAVPSNLKKEIPSCAVCLLLRLCLSEEASGRVSIVWVSLQVLCAIESEPLAQDQYWEPQQYGWLRWVSCLEDSERRVQQVISFVTKPYLFPVWRCISQSSAEMWSKTAPVVGSK